MKSRILLVDLNNFARFPSIAIGYIVAPLRAAGFAVELVSPLAHGQSGVQRERREVFADHFKRRMYLAPPLPLSHLQDRMYLLYDAWQQRLSAGMKSLLEETLQSTDAKLILLSAYLQHRPLITLIAAAAARRNIPVLLGGPAFNLPGVASAWKDIPGVTQIYPGEADLAIVSLARHLTGNPAHEPDMGAALREPLAADSAAGAAAPRIRNLDDLPFPEYSDFPWHKYPHRVIPVLAARGCSWGRCTFCSDIVTASGRGFRTRRAVRVLDELDHQAKRYGSKDFIFLDIKLNSDVSLWRGLINGIQERVPGARWIGTVHVDIGEDNGLDRPTLLAASRAGLTRVSFGLESGSQRMLQLMSKGCTVARNETFLDDASEAGLSVRATMMTGYPGETADDIEQSADFLARNRDKFDRIKLGRFRPIPGTRFDRLYRRRPSLFPDISGIDWMPEIARGNYFHAAMREGSYRRALHSLLRIVHDVNRKPLRDNAIQFDGLM